MPVYPGARPFAPPRLPGLHHYYEPVRRPASPRYSTPPVSAVRRAPSRPQPVAEISIDTGLPTFHASAADRARAAFTPDTTWPVSRHPPGPSRRLLYSPVSMSPSCFDASTTVRFRSPSRSPPDASRAPFPHRSPRRSSTNASMRRFDASPCRATPEGQPPSPAQHRFTRSLLQQLPPPRSWRTQDQHAGHRVDRG